MLSMIERLTKALEVATRQWAEIEAGSGQAPVPEMRPTRFAVPLDRPPGTDAFAADQLATFRIRVREPWRGRGATREFIVTITESEVPDGR